MVAGTRPSEHLRQVKQIEKGRRSMAVCRVWFLWQGSRPVEGKERHGRQGRAPRVSLNESVAVRLNTWT